MLTIGATKYTLSEVITLLKTNPGTVWVKSYPYYLLKINNSGQATFTDLPGLIMKLAGYVMGEPKEQGALQRYRGTFPNANSAMVLPPIKATEIKQEDRVAVAALIASGDVDATAGVTNKSAHSSDPETGFLKGGGVGVSEFYINGAEGRRATRRTEGTKVTYYYSDSHAYNTYKYQRLI
jgi:hypothetical protein